MISPEYCQTMARYNQWQNNGLRDVVKSMNEDELRQDRGAFFGSILETLNHLLWGDTLWISRFDGGPSTEASIQESRAFTASGTEWAAERFRMDGRISEWARKLASIDLVGDLHWYSGALGRDMVKPKAICVMQLFNHQTHHRGQVHAMLTAAGHTLNDTDLPFIPEG
ncbi:DinB family protein [Octadecabacter ascidiaceicola]|uniref:DinB family protein n=1 Tax=Octadecabacter ascidiaceicola TaxID=1655543 RepID=A0A238JKT6_9RHOB|nr:DinB family protein [Octadecabacter ascidiaceicola]SMX30797.1 DinB family protein [Octadecabacter ascidiaceicola]